MELLENHFYEIKINLHGRIEGYEGKVQSIGKGEFRFETEDDNACRALTLKLKDLIYKKEIFPNKNERIHKISTRKKFTNLKQSDLPEF